MSGSPRCIFAWVLSWSTHTSIGTHVASWPSKGLCYKMGPESHVPSASPRFYRDSVTGTATRSRWILSKYLPCLHFWIVQDFVKYVLFHVRKPKMHLCMSTKLKHTSLNKYACSKLAQQKFMRQVGRRVTHYERPASFLSTLTHWHSRRKQRNLVQFCHASTLSRLGQRRISCWIVQDFAGYFCVMSGSPRFFAWILSWSTHTSIGTDVASWPSRGLCDKVGPESRVMNAPPCFYGHSVTGTATKSRWILSKFAMPPLFPG